MDHSYKNQELTGDAPKTDLFAKFTLYQESITIVLLIVIGFGGLASIPLSPFGGERADRSNFDMAAQVPVSSSLRSQPAQGQPLDEQRSSHPQLLIEGAQQVGTKLQFTIDNFDAKADYRLYIGDRASIAVHEKTFWHSFDQPGTYDLVLKVSYQSETAVLFEEPLEIESDWLTATGN
ncbi:MAG: hypothetical protein AAFV95_23760 [Bacteroidota bacterium]